MNGEKAFSNRRRDWSSGCTPHGFSIFGFCFSLSANHQPHLSSGDKRLSWEPEVEEIKRRTELAKQMGGEANVARHHTNGRLTVRERIERLLDSNSFHEVGALAGRATYEAGQLASFTPSNFVFGTGRIDGRKVVVGGDDFTVRGGAADGAVGY